MASASKPVFSVQVRELVEFALRQGDLGGARDFVGPNRALAGTRGHQRLQRSRPAGYQKELRLSHEIETAEFILRIQGRIDGLLVSAEELLLEEIKTVQGGWDRAASAAARSGSDREPSRLAAHTNTQGSRENTTARTPRGQARARR